MFVALSDLFLKQDHYCRFHSFTEKYVDVHGGGGGVEERTTKYCWIGRDSGISRCLSLLLLKGKSYHHRTGRPVVRARSISFEPFLKKKEAKQ